MGASNQLNNFTYLEVPNCLRETGTGGSNPLTPAIHSFKRSCRVVPAKSRQVLSDVRLLPIVAKPQVLEHCLGRQCLIHTFPSVRFRLLIQPVDATQAVIR